MHDLYEIKPFRFLLWWIACSIFVFPLAIVAVGLVIVPSVFILSFIVPNHYEFRIIETVLSLLAFPVIGAVIGASLALLQGWLLRNKLYWVADKWMRWSMIGGAVGACVVVGSAMILEQVMPFYYYNDNAFLYYLPIFLAVVSAFQLISLRHAVKQSWLWLIANSVAGIVFAGVLSNNQPEFYDSGWFTMGLALFSVTALGLITGFTMLFLFEKKLQPMQGETNELELDDTPKSVWDRAI